MLDLGKGPYKVNTNIFKEGLSFSHETFYKDKRSSFNICIVTMFAIFYIWIHDLGGENNILRKWSILGGDEYNDKLDLRTNPFPEEGYDGGTSGRTHIGHLTMARRLEEEEEEAQKTLFCGELIVVYSSNFSSFVKFLQSSIGFILGLYLDNFLGPCFRPIFMGHVLSQLEYGVNRKKESS